MYYIIIPFRENPKEQRNIHKKYFIENTVPLLKKCLIKVKIIFIIQEPGAPFNRGALINIAVKLINSNPEDIFFTHDVDVNPYENTIVKYYKPFINNKCIQGIYTSAWDTLGGIIKFKKQDFIDINGFSNMFWGWGGEDTDLQNRATFNNIWIQKNLTNRPGDGENWFKIFNHPRNKESVKNNIKKYFLHQYPRFSKNKVEKYIKTNGLTTVNYSVKSDVIEEYIRHILVSIPYEPDNINKYLENLKKMK